MLAYSLLNPVRFRTYSDYEFNHNRNYCYFQKWQKGDIINLQFLCDSKITIEVREFKSKKIVRTYRSITIPSSLVNQPFKIEELSILLEDLPYYGKFLLRMKSDNMESFFWSEPFDYKEICYNTILFKYRNETNDFDVIFETGIEFYFRTEGTINNFVPKSDSVIYFDQRRNATKLYGVTYRVFTLFIGAKMGVPDWVIDLSNMILVCDEKLIDGFSFEKNEGSEFEIKRIDNYALCSGSIEIVQTENKIGSGFIFDKFVFADNESNAVSDIEKNLIIIKK